MLEDIDHITIGVRDHEDVLRILVTLNNTGDDLTVGQFENLVVSTLHSYRDVDVNAHAYARQEADNFVLLDVFENPLSFEVEELPLLAPPRILTKEVAYELGDMGLELSGYTKAELDKAVARSEQKCLIMWTIEDVNQQALDDGVEVFTTDQAMLVLQKIKTDHDAGEGCNWDVVSSLIGQVVG